MRRLLSTLAVLLLVCGLVSAQTKSGDPIKLKLKTDEVLEGRVKLVDEDGVKLDIGDGIELYIRWGFTRGDHHFDLRKGVTDFKKVESILKLADFCHEFALDEQEANMLAEALKIDPENAEARARLAALPKPAGVVVPAPPADVEKPRTDPPKDLPPAKRGPFSVTVEFEKDDTAAADWMREELDKLSYKKGSARDHEIRIRIDMTLTLVRNPKFMGADLYAVYEGKMTWQLFKKGEKTPFARDSAKTDEVRRDTKAEALDRCRTDLLEAAFPAMHAAMEKQR